VRVHRGTWGNPLALLPGLLVAARGVWLAVLWVALRVVWLAVSLLVL